MSDEKRPTRLLPFRLRRAAHARRADFAQGAPDAPDASDTLDTLDTLDDAAALQDDEELSALLRAWDAPAPSDASRARLLAGFRAEVRPAPLWRRALSAELRVPLPLAACAALALLASLVALAARAQTATAAATTANAPAEARGAEAASGLKVVEVPVERERVVTRVVYVGRDAARAGARQFAAAEQPASARRGFDAAQAATRAALAQSDASRANAGRARTAFDPAAQSAGEPTSYFTRVDMADFEPADEMKIRIVKRGKTGEK